MSDDIVVVKHEASGATAKVHLFGATVLSYVTGDGQEHLFVSKEAKMDGSKAIRGGIPIVFPIFGPPKEQGNTMPQHGFARLNKWVHKETESHDDMSTTATFELVYSTQVEKGIGEGNFWSHEQAKADGTDCKLTYTVRVEEKELTCTLVVENTGTSAFSFQALFHTYLAVDDSACCKVHGLGGYAITDKVSGDSGHVQSYDDDIEFNGKEVDAVYIHPDNHPTVHAKLLPKGLRVEGAGQVDEQVSTVSCVVWNPGPEKSKTMSDFDDEEYKKMICIEPGLIGHQPLLSPGASARLSQSILVGE